MSSGLKSNNFYHRREVSDRDGSSDWYSPTSLIQYTEKSSLNDDRSVVDTCMSDPDQATLLTINASVPPGREQAAKRKQRTKTLEVLSSVSSLQMPSEAEPVKRKRGRPRKDPQALIQKQRQGWPQKSTGKRKQLASPGKPSEEDPVKGKSQGQSPTTPLTVSSVTPSGIPSGEELAKKQGRGRRNKKNLASPGATLNNAPGEHTMTGVEGDITQTQAGSSTADMAPECEELYRKIASTYGRIDENVPKVLGNTFLVLKTELLKTIRDMKHTPPSDLTDEMVSQWEESHKIAAACYFNVGWMSTTLVKMRDYVSRKEKARIVEALEAETESNFKQMKQMEKALAELSKANACNVARLENAKQEQKAEEPLPSDTQFFDI